MRGITLGFALAALLLVVAPTAGLSSSDDSGQACFGAASHDVYHPCDNPSLRDEVVPSPAVARDGSNAPCATITDEGPLRVCTFGTPEADARATIALLGDSHAAHWRAALEFAANAEHWRGVSLTLSGCPYSTATRVLRTALRNHCIARNRAIPGWFARHPEIHTVFVSELSGARWTLPRTAQSAFEGEERAYVDAWGQLPRSVKQIVVIRDTPKATPATASCIDSAHAQSEDAGSVCALPRSDALDRDAAASAARSVGAPRLRTLDMTRFFCNERVCPPVIGGALVQKDLHHLSIVFVRTLGPYLLGEMHRLDPARY